MKATTETLSLRLAPEEKALIDEAARLLDTTPSAFILDAAIRHARAVLADETHLKLSPEQWSAFTKLLDAPAGPNPALDRLLNTPAPWDEPGNR